MVYGFLQGRVRSGLSLIGGDGSEIQIFQGVAYVCRLLAVQHTIPELLSDSHPERVLFSKSYHLSVSFSLYCGAEFDGEDVFAKIYDFIWQDPEEYLNDGRLELSATAEEQPTLEQIVSILPQSILAKTGETAENTSADEAEDITADEADITADYDVEIKVSGWQCEDYIQNEDGMRTGVRRLQWKSR